MNSINRLYEILEEWRAHFQGVDCISVMDFGDELRIRIDWKGDNNHPYYTHIFTKEDLKDLEWFNFADTFLLNNIETQYKKWEVGEE